MKRYKRLRLIYSSVFIIIIMRIVRQFMESFLYRHDDVKDLVAVIQSKFNQELGVINDEIKSEYRVLNYGSQPGIIVEVWILIESG